MIFTKKNMFFILFIAVFVACCVFSNKVFAEENVSLSTLINANISNGYVVDTSDSRNKVDFFLTEDNFIYTISFNFSASHNLYISTTEPQFGVSVQRLVSLEPGQTYTFVGNSKYYLSNYSGSNNDRFTVTREPVNQYDNTIDNLTQAISLDNLWSQFGVGLIALAVFFAIGFFVVRKVLKKDSQYKG